MKGERKMQDKALSEGVSRLKPALAWFDGAFSSTCSSLLTTPFYPLLILALRYLMCCFTAHHLHNVDT